MSPVVLISAAAFGAMSIFAKIAYQADVTVATLLSGRFILAAVVFWGVIVYRRLGLPSVRASLAGLLLGEAIYSVQALLLFAALTHLSAGLGGLVLYIYPALVMTAAVMLGRERQTRRKTFAFILAAVGIILVLGSSRSRGVDMIGMLLALGSAVVYAGYIVAADTLVRRVHPLVLASLVCSGAACTCTGVALFMGQLHPAVQPAGWIALVVIALVSTIGAIGLFLSGVSRVGPSTASILSMVEPLVTVTVAFAYLVLGESILPLQGAGGALILSAILVVRGWRRVPIRRHRRQLHRNVPNLYGSVGDGPRSRVTPLDGATASRTRAC